MPFGAFVSLEIQMPNNWKEQRAKDRITTRFDEVREVSIVNYAKDMSLENIPVNKAYRMDAVHLYVEILNFDEILSVTAFEGETCHRRALRFLNLHFRAVHRILDDTSARRVDFHNERLHAVIAKPYGAENERDRVVRAVAIADLTRQVLEETGDTDEKIPNARIRVGIDSGAALVVNNGRRGGREPLFLGCPANLAAKCAGAAEEDGIYLTNTARQLIGLDVLPRGADRTTALTADQIASCVEEADLGIDKASIVDAWTDEQADTPIGDINVIVRPRHLSMHRFVGARSRAFGTEYGDGGEQARAVGAAGGGVRA